MLGHGVSWREFKEGGNGHGGKERVDLKWTCFHGQCNQAVEAVVWFGVWQHVISKTEQSFLNEINPLLAVENVCQILEYPHDGGR